jgi:precorrin isomerase
VNPDLPEYLCNPEDIYRRSFELVRAETDLSDVPSDLQPIVVRLVHACGMPDIVNELAWSSDVVAASSDALEAGATLITDCQMVSEGIMRSRLPTANEVLCTLNDPNVPKLAHERATTRSAAAVDLWQAQLAGAVVAIGNAPTALFRLLELLAAGSPRPAAVLAFPVGFVGAAESKEALMSASLGAPYLTLRGRRGGSALAAAAVNALCDERR